VHIEVHKIKKVIKSTDSVIRIGLARSFIRQETLNSK